jgi:hypothetical protein
MKVEQLIINNVPFGRKFKFKTEFELKIQEQTAFEFGPNLWEVQT